MMVARLQKYLEYMREFYLLERLLFCEGGTNKKTHFKSHVLASPVQLSISSYERVVPLLTIERKKSKSTKKPPFI